MAAGLMKAYSDLVEHLYDDSNPGSALVGKLAQKMNQKREVAFATIVAPYLLYLIVGGLAELLCNAVAFAYPAYASIMAIESTSKDDDTQWLTYWTVFGIFSICDTFAGPIWSYFPFYWALKAAFLYYLYNPKAQGAKVIWETKLLPVIDSLGLCKSKEA